MNGLLRRLKLLTGLAALASFGAASAIADTVLVDKAPDYGGGFLWRFLDGNPNGTYIYANSFQLSTSANATTLGTYILNMGTTGQPGTQFRYELWSDTGGSGPNPAGVLGVTAEHNVTSTTMVLDTMPLLTPVTLTAGVRYWVIASTIGQTANGRYGFGAHAYNPVTYDGGSFVFSQSPTGFGIDGGGAPELAIYVAGTGISAVPEPSTLSLLLVPVAGLLLRRRRGPSILANS